MKKNQQPTHPISANGLIAHYPTTSALSTIWLLIKTSLLATMFLLLANSSQNASAITNGDFEFDAGAYFNTQTKTIKVTPNTNYSFYLRVKNNSTANIRGMVLNCSTNSGNTLQNCNSMNTRDFSKYPTVGPLPGSESTTFSQYYPFESTWELNAGQVKYFKVTINIPDVHDQTSLNLAFYTIDTGESAELNPSNSTIINFQRDVNPTSQSCPSGWNATFPECGTAPPPETCPTGQSGTPPNCTEPPPETCPTGQSGTPPNCTVDVTPPPPPPPSGGSGAPSEMTPRDIDLISFGIAIFAGYKAIMGFRWRSDV
jgi:hypothetical protein